MGERVYLIKGKGGKRLSIYASNRDIAMPWIQDGGWREVGWLRYQLFRLGVIDG